MNRNDIEKFLGLVKDQPFAIWMRHSTDEEFTYDIEVATEVELLEECLIIGEEEENEDGTKNKYWSIINLADIIYMNSNY